MSDHSSLFDAMYNQPTREEKALNRHKTNFSVDQSFNDLADTFYGSSRKIQEVKELPLDKIDVKKQVRTTFSEEAIDELAESIKQNGLLQPIVVYRIENSRFCIICGESRFRAVQKLGNPTIRAIIIEEPKNESEVLTLQIIENLHRTNPPVVDIANAVDRLYQDNNKVEDICSMISSKKSYVYNLLNIAKLGDHEKETYKDMGTGFFASYTALKKDCENSGSELCDQITHKCSCALLDLAMREDKNGNTPEERKKIINRIFEEIVKKAAKVKAPKTEPSDNEDNILGKKLSLSWEKIDKIEPDLSIALEEFMFKHRDLKLVDVVATALSDYLNTHG